MGRGGVGGVGRDDDGVFKGTVPFQTTRVLNYFGGLLSNGDIDSDDIGIALVDSGRQYKLRFYQ